VLDYEMGHWVASLRSELRELVAEHVPVDYLGAFTADPADLEIAQAFCRLLAERGLLCMAWPEEFGGRGASGWEQTAVREEMWALHEPRGAQLSTGARRDGDEWVISGQKIWTSYATMAQWCFLLARTSREERKQQGLTVFLVPMADPAIEVRPIDCMMGPHHLNEVFFDEVRVDDGAVLGTVGDGWSTVQEVLAFERVGIARYARCERLLQWAPVALGDQWADLPPELAAGWARMLVHCRRSRLLAYRVVATQDSGQVRPGDAAAYRIAVTRLDQESAEVLMDIVGCASLGSDEQRRFARAVEDHHRYSVAATVSSGSIEMQRILLSRTLLAAS
jgi:alkylation response protein AidB-like acyl-CoA dehydrogenase